MTPSPLTDVILLAIGAATGLTVSICAIVATARLGDILNATLGIADLMERQNRRYLCRRRQRSIGRHHFDRNHDYDPESSNLPARPR